MTTQFDRGAQALAKMVQQLSIPKLIRAKQICALVGVHFDGDRVDPLTMDVLAAARAVKKLTQLDPVNARRVIDTFIDEEMADILMAFSQARVDREGENSQDAFDESIAARLERSAKAVAA